MPAAHPDIYRRWQVRVEPFGESWRQRLRSGGAVLFGASALLPLIAGANVGCLLLARVLDRRHELAVRAALGAPRSSAAWLLLKSGLTPLAFGIGGGALAVVLLGRLMTAVVYGVTAFDPVTFALSAALLVLVALGASLVPARRVSRIDPAAAMRNE